MYDADTLYVAMRLFDTAPDSGRVQLTRRDTDAGSPDWARVVIDVVLTSAVLHVARDEAPWKAMLHEMWRVLALGGLFSRD